MSPASERVGPAGPDDARAGPSRRSTLLGLAIGLPVSALFLVLAARGVDPGTVAGRIRAADGPLLACGAAALLVLHLAQAERWRILARPLGPAPRRGFLAITFAGLAASNVVPGRPGDLLRGYWLGRMTSQPGGRALATVVVDRVADLVALLALLAVTLPFVPHPGWLQALVVGVVALVALLLAAIGAAWLYARTPRGRRARCGRRSLLARHLSAFVRGLPELLRPRAIAAAAGLSLLAWAAWAGAAWLVAASLEVQLSPVQIGFVAAVVNLGSAIPSSPGFVGTYQWLAVASLGLFGVTHDAAFAVAVVLHAAWFVPVTLIGLSVAGWWSLGGRRPGESRRRSTSPPPALAPALADILRPAS
jgi:uncharacterized protein (TIRG00374 family)